jgi:hypothetical protein
VRLDGGLAGAADNGPQHGGDDDGVVGVAEDRDEVRDQVDRDRQPRVFMEILRRCD